ncbi:hypothetical protein PRIPAC_94148, partial [Pristionchus pacificus]|uniref:Uncharacterized protein n=1 Tax=Pristionchus pacificus TaxID=54126 RepID=A0A2A6BAY6_PRIPA
SIDNLFRISSLFWLFLPVPSLPTPLLLARISVREPSWDSLPTVGAMRTSSSSTEPASASALPIARPSPRTLDAFPPMEFPMLNCGFAASRRSIGKPILSVTANAGAPPFLSKNLFIQDIQ